jgi:hypothetical protein
MTTAQGLQFIASFAAILGVAWLVRWMGLGGDVRIRDDDHARELAWEAIYGFDAVAMARDKAGFAALLRDASGRQLLIRRHGAHFAGRLLEPGIEARLDRHLLTIAIPDRFGSTTLNLGEAAQVWAAGLRQVGRV